MIGIIKDLGPVIEEGTDLKDRIESTEKIIECLVY
jgi:hypothetical protein